MNNDFITVLSPVLNAALVIMGGFIVKKVVKFYPVFEAFIVARTGLAKYNKIKAVAIDIWNKIEEDGRLGKLTNSKIATFESYIKFKFPRIDASDILLLNKSIAGEFNKDKAAVAEAVKVADTIVAPKYVNEKGETLVLEKTL